MTHRRPATPNHTARSAGLLYLTLIPLGFFGVLYVPSLVVPGDAAATVDAIAASAGMFRTSLVSVLLMNIVSVAIVLLLHTLLAPVGKRAAAFMVAFLVLGAGISMLNELNHFAALTLSSANPTGFSAEQTQYLVSLFLDLHEYGAYIATIFWGLWLFPLGDLIIRSNFLPRVLGVLLIVAGVGYLIESGIYFLLPQYGTALSNYTFIGEVLFPLWLLVKGVNVGGWKKLVPEIA